MSHPTLLRPPPPDPTRSPIENDLELTEMTVLGPDIFTNTRPPWHPPGARGIYGGTVVAMSLAAGQRTVDAAFALHSCHCYFLLAGNGDVPMLFHVERVRDGRSFATRTVQARQRGRCIFTVTMSFVRSTSSSSSSTPATVHHAAAMPVDRPPLPPPDFDDRHSAERAFNRELARVSAGVEGDDDNEDDKNDEEAKDDLQPVMATQMRVVGDADAPPRAKKTQQWVRVRGTVSPQGGRAAHLTALAYLSDRYFIGTIGRLHRLWRFPFGVETLLGEGDDGRAFYADHPRLAARARAFADFEVGEAGLAAFRGQPAIGMLVSLDHSIYFHEPDRVQADDWMLAEMESPWADEGRGVVAQRIFSKDGTLLATCMQEGVVRLKNTKAKI